MATHRSLEILATALLVASLMPASQSAHARPKQLRGDPQAVERIERMLEQLGGAQAWAEARSLYLDYRGWRTDPDGPLVERAWRDLHHPNQRIELDGASAPLTWVFTPDSGWVARPSGVAPIPPERHAAALADWPFDFYTIIRSFAVVSDQFSLEFIAPRRVLVRSAAGADWGWWEIDSDGALVKWGANFGDESVEYVYGPIRDFGTVRFPAWGAATDGSWRFDYADVRLSPDPIPSDLLKRPQ